MENLRVFHDAPFSLSASQSTSAAARVTYQGADPAQNITLPNEGRAALSLYSQVGEEREGAGAGVQAAVWDVRGQRWLLVTRDCRVFCVCCTTHRVLFQRSLVDMEGIPAPDAVTHSALLQFQDALFLAFATGDLLLLHLPPPSVPASASTEGVPQAGGSEGTPGAGRLDESWGSLEVVGEVKGGCVGGAWSPSEDSLALVSGDGKLLCMTSDWDVTAEVDFLPSPSEGAIDSNSASARLEPGAVSVSWRGDGAFFATSHVTSHESQPQEGRHAPAAPPAQGRVRVWEAGTCTLHSQSDELLPVQHGHTGGGGEQDPQGCLSLPVAWQPSGALIAVGCSQKSSASAHGLPEGRGKQTPSDYPRHTLSLPVQGRPDTASSGLRPQQEPSVPKGEESMSAPGLEVVLLERNGMLRSRFPLQAPRGATILALAWSSDSRILSATLRCANSGFNAFQLYHRLNYKWYLKHEWRVPDPWYTTSHGIPPHPYSHSHTGEHAGGHGEGLQEGGYDGGIPTHYHSHPMWHAGAGLEWHPERPLELLLWGPWGTPLPADSNLTVETLTTGSDLALRSAETAARGAESAILRHVRLHWESACPLDVAASGRGSVAAVVDGARVLVTDFGSAVIPPPMCGRELNLPAPVRTAAVLPPPHPPHSPHTPLPPTSSPNPTVRTASNACYDPMADDGAVAVSRCSGSRGGGKLVAVLADGSLCVVTGPGATGMSQEEEEDLEEDMREGEGREGEGNGTPAEASATGVPSEGSGTRANGAPLAFRRTEVRQLALRSLLRGGSDVTRAKALPSSCLQHSQHICWLTEDSVLIALSATDAELLLRETSAGGGPQGQQGQLTGARTTQGSLLLEVVIQESEEEHSRAGNGTSGGPKLGEVSQGYAYVIDCMRTPQPVVALASTSSLVMEPHSPSAGSPGAQVQDPTALVHLKDGQVLEYQGGHTSCAPTARHHKGTAASQGQLRSLGKLPAVCPWLAAVQIPAGTAVGRQDPDAQESSGLVRGTGTGGWSRSRGAPGMCLAGLSESRQLFVGQHCIASECTSFLLLSLPSLPQAPALQLPPLSAIFSPSSVSLAVAYTTASGFLVCQDLDSQGAPAGGVPDVEGARKVLEGGPRRKGREALKKLDPRVVPVHERGARLAGALGAADPGLVLLAPRGNLEVVYPRWLVLKCLGSALLQGSFLEAFQLARRHRLDLNVLVDFWGWPVFVRHVARRFVAQVASEDVRLVSELVCCLRSEESTHSQEGAYGALALFRDARAQEGSNGAFLIDARRATSASSIAFSSAQSTSPSVSGASASSGDSKPGFSQAVPDLDVDLLFRDLEVEEGGSGTPLVTRKADPLPEEMGKVTAVCAAIREALLRRGTPQERSGTSHSAGLGHPSAAEELCVLTTYACSDPPLLEEALGRVRAARDWELNLQQRQSQHPLKAAPAVGKRGTVAEEPGAQGSFGGSVVQAVGAGLGAAGPGGVGQERRFGMGRGAGGGEEGEDVSALLPLGPATNGTVTNGNRVATKSSDPASPVLSAEASLKHLMWLTSADRVLDAALGLYDLPLAALAVVHHPGKDPREYFPLLQGLASLPPPLMRFRIDVRLGRLERAVQDLADALRSLPGCTQGAAPSDSGSKAEPAVALPSSEAEAESAGGAAPSAGTSGGHEEGSGSEGEEEVEEEVEVSAGLPAVYQSCLRECLALVQAHPGRLFPVAAAAFQDAPGTPGPSPGQIQPSPSPSSAAPAGSVEGGVRRRATEGSVVGRVRRVVVEQWGAHLESQELHSEAALAFLAAGRPLRALAAYRAGGSWRSALGVARRMKWGSARVRALAGDMREELVALGKKAEGGRVAAEYEGDVETAVGLLVEGQQWEEAVHLGYARDRADLVRSLVVPSALAAAHSLVSEFAETQAKIRAYLVRHQTVRQRRVALARRVQEAEADGWGDGDEDSASTASALSTASGLTQLSAYAPRGGPSGAGSSAASTGETGSLSGASATTAGGRRPSGRAEKRAAAKQRKAKGGGRIRAGSPGEELAILEHLKALAPPPSVKAEVGQLLEILVGCAGAEEAARKLQRCLQTLLKMHSRALKFLRDQEGKEGKEGKEGEEGKGGGEGKSGQTTGVPEGEGGQDGAAWKWRLLEM